MVRGHLEESLEQLKAQCLDMMQKIDDQFTHVLKALETGDTEEAEFVDWQEKAINKKELLIDKECEKILALYGPVANDLRFILSVIEMNTHLERIGDLLQTIALNIVETPELAENDLEKEFKILEKFRELMENYRMTVDAFRTEDLRQARDIFVQNRHVRKFFNRHKSSILAHLKKTPKKAELFLNQHTNMLTIIRIADMVDNIMEELVFYVEAKVLKHVKKKHKKVEQHMSAKENTDESVDVDISKEIKNPGSLDQSKDRDLLEDDLDS